jgi:hypothetical protein
MEEKKETIENNFTNTSSRKSVGSVTTDEDHDGVLDDDILLTNNIINLEKTGSEDIDLKISEEESFQEYFLGNSTEIKITSLNQVYYIKSEVK